MGAGAMFDKAKDALSDHDDKVDEAVDQADSTHGRPTCAAGE